MQNVAATVTVVTAYGPTEPVGITVSAFTAVSADPPIILVCIDKGAASLETLLAADGFTVNFLAQGSADTAMIFATRDGDKFGAVKWDPPEVEGSGPVLDEAVVRSGIPLVYLNRTFVDLDVDNAHPSSDV
jgi:flavin reductase (DIM6/NTAB) family NADH-FMN oxidoreductase RutF